MVCPPGHRARLRPQLHRLKGLRRGFQREPMDVERLNLLPVPPQPGRHSAAQGLRYTPAETDGDPQHHRQLYRRHRV